MGCMIHARILEEKNGKKVLTEQAKRKFIQEVKDIIRYGTDELPSNRRPLFDCGVVPKTPTGIIPELEDEKQFPEFHKDILGKYEKFAITLDAESQFSLLPIADPIALAGKFGVELPPVKFPEGFTPYLTGLLVPKFSLDLVKAGNTKFFPPVKLAAEFPKLIPIEVPPKPPSFDIPPKFELPPPIPGISLPEIPNASLSIPGALPPIPTPPNPLTSSLDMAADELAMATGIPKLIATIIAKIPSLVSKLPDMKSIASEICKTVQESGVFGKTDPDSTDKQAADIVLSRKLSECIFLHAVAKTIGSSPGSIGPQAIKTISDPDNYEIQQQPPPTPPITTPQQRAVNYAQGLKGTSFSGSESSAYISGLFYIEDSLSQIGSDILNLYGEVVPNNEKKTLNDVGVVANPPNTKLTDAIAKAATLVINGPLQKVPVPYTQGFLEYARSYAADASSCALFVRSCYFAGGCNNEFFISQYPQQGAVQGIINLGIMRNYRWLGDEGILKKVNQNDIDKCLKISLIGWNLVVEKGIVVPNDKTIKNILGEFIKPYEQRTIITDSEIKHMVGSKKIEPHPIENQFPTLYPGDAILVRNPNDAQSEHIMLVTETRKGSKFPTPPNPTGFVLETPIIGIEGGQVDDGNEGGNDISGVKSTYSGTPPKVQEGPNKGQPDGSATKNAKDGDKYVEGEVVYVFSTAGGGVWKASNDLFKKHRPTAILSTRYDLGSQHDFGFWVGSSTITTTNGNVFSNPPGPNGPPRKIMAIIRGKEFLKKEENEGIEAAAAAIKMDSHVDMKKLMNSLRDPGRLQILAQFVFDRLQHGVR